MPPSPGGVFLLWGWRRPAAGAYYGLHENHTGGAPFLLENRAGQALAWGSAQETAKCVGAARLQGGVEAPGQRGSFLERVARSQKNRRARRLRVVTERGRFSFVAWLRPAAGAWYGSLEDHPAGAPFLGEQGGARQFRSQGGLERALASEVLSVRSGGSSLTKKARRARGLAG